MKARVAAALAGIAAAFLGLAAIGFWWLGRGDQRW